MPTNVISNPFPLGSIGPGADFATLSMPITNNFPDLGLPGVYGQVDSLYVHALADNTGVVYLTNNDSAPDTGSFLNVVDFLAAGASVSVSSSAMNTIQLSQYFIGASDDASGAIITVKFR